MFIKDDNNNVALIKGNFFIPEKQLEAGVYSLTISYSMNGTAINLTPVHRYDVDFNITAGIYDEVIDYVNDFIDPAMYEARLDMGKLNKLGLIFKGDPGTGKTFLAGQIGYYLSKVKNAVTLLVTGTEDSYNFAQLIDQIREHDKDRFIVLIFDEFEKDSCNTELLSFLDGANSRDNCLILATINDDTRLPNWIKERRGRFEKIFTFKISDVNVFESIVTCMLPEKYRGIIDISKIYKICETVGMTIDDISIETRNTLYRHKKILADPSCVERFNRNLASYTLKNATVEDTSGKEITLVSNVRFDEIEEEEELAYA